MGTASTQNTGYENHVPDRNLAMELVRVTESASIAAGRWVGRGDKNTADGAAVAAMREMIFADKPEDRRLALDRILPMQRQDFTALFEIMAGLPVTIRLFDPPLHEFLPHDREGMRELAESLDLPLSDVTRRVEALSEFNPMLGMRGVRLVTDRMPALRGEPERDVEQAIRAGRADELKLVDVLYDPSQTGEGERDPRVMAAALHALPRRMPPSQAFVPNLLDGLPMRLATTDARRLDIGRRAARIVSGKDPRPEDGIVALAPTFLPGDTIRRAR